MRDTRLIFVEGLPGLGKTTTASWLASRLHSEHLDICLYLEHQSSHPLNVGGDSFPAGDVLGEPFFQQYTPQSFVEESLQKWEIYIHTASTRKAIGIVDYLTMTATQHQFQRTAATPLVVRTWPEVSR